jgi:hypothetical protein
MAWPAPLFYWRFGPDAPAPLCFAPSPPVPRSPLSFSSCKSRTPHPPDQVTALSFLIVTRFSMPKLPGSTHPTSPHRPPHWQSALREKGRRHLFSYPLTCSSIRPEAQTSLLFQQHGLTAAFRILFSHLMVAVGQRHAPRVPRYTPTADYIRSPFPPDR